jgi:putative aminopeptidase FrvX
LYLELTQIPGGTGDERKVADTIQQKLGAMGYHATEDGAGKEIGGNTGNLILNVPGAVQDAPGLIVMAHMDTVDLAVGTKPVEKNGVIYSDGRHALGADDRAGCAEVLEMLRILKENNIQHPPLQIIFTVGEEGGLLGSSALNKKDLKGNLGFCVDSFHPNEIMFGWDGPLISKGNGPVHRAMEQEAEKQFARPDQPSDVIQGNNDGDNFILNFTRDGIRDIGLQPKERKLFGADSDAHALRDAGIPAITIGAGEQDIHTRSEHVSVEDLGKSTELLLALVSRANNFKVDGQGNITPR